MTRGAPRWLVAIAASVALHGAAAALILAGKGDDEVMVAGGAPVSVAILGNAFEDGLAAGSPDSEEAALAEIAEAAEAAQPVEPAAAEPEIAAEAPAIEPSAAQSKQAPPAGAQVPAPAETVTAPSGTAIEAAPDVPASIAAVPVEAVEAEAAETQPDRAADIAPETPATSEDAETASVAEAVEPEPAEAVEDVPEDPLHPANVLASLEAVPTPSARPDYQPPARQAEAPRQERTREPRPQPQRQARRETAGSGGNAQADTWRGSSDGQAQGSSAASGSGQQASAAGNAAVSNYPGQVVSRLRRALRYPGEARRERLRGEVHVSFSVSANGGVASARVVRSSGHQVLDQAALETIRRAAPFPAIPTAAGRRSWDFTVPLAFSR
jgi:periplasmic protein TonB